MIRKSLTDLARRALQCRRGNVAVVIALAMPIFVGGAGLAVETSFDYHRQLTVQAAADAAAYAAALEDSSGGNDLNYAAQEAATDNGWRADSGSLQLTTATNAGVRSVTVELTQQLPRFFTALFSDAPLTAAGRAVAIQQNAAAACVIALNKTASQAVKVSGSAHLTVVGCDVISNSVADDAIYVWGSSEMTTECVVSAGGVQESGGLELTDCAGPVTQAPRVRDPLEALAEATPPACTNKVIKKNASLTPAHYCSGMNLSGTTTLAPGDYYVSGGDFDVNANASVSGSGVTIHLIGDSQVSMAGNSTASLSAPTSGTYAGVLFFGDRDNAGGVNKINGNASSQLTGHLYFPTQAVEYLGNFSGAGGCTHIIADTLVWTGSASVDVDCSDYGMTPLPGRQAVRLAQ